MAWQDIRGLELWAKPEESNQLRMGPMELYALEDRDIESLELSPEARHAIYEGNARRLLRLG